jgi:ATP-binding cassette subfamily B protein
MHFFQGFSISLMFIAMLYFLIQLRMRQLVTIGDFALILGMSVDVGFITWWTLEQFDELNKAIGKAQQSLTALFLSHYVQEKADARKLIVSAGKIEFCDVTFHYQGSDPLLVKESRTMQPGEKIGLVGYSGGGKSTFLNLILRLYDLIEGKILIDGQDISLMTQESLREGIGMIPQDPGLFHRSLMDNIRYGRLSATDDEVIEAAKKAHAHEFIINLPEGYHALVGERGVKLSGGERQRIAIARAMLRNAPILMLDEATSQLDSITEHYIQESLWLLMQGKTTLVIAHRLST